MKKLLFPLFALIFAGGGLFAQVPTITNSTKLKFLEGDNTWLGTALDFKTYVGAGAGTVTSVGLSLPASLYNVTGSPVTGSGTLAATLVSQTANTFFGAPDGTAGTPSFRSLVAADIPTLPASKVTGANLTAGSTKISIGTGTGAVLVAATVDVNEANLNLANMGGTLGVGHGGTGVTAVGGNGTILGSDGTNNLYLNPTIGTSAAPIAFSRSGSNLILNLPDADASNRGTVNNTTQTFAGAKTFSSLLTGSGGILGTATSTAAAVKTSGVRARAWTFISSTSTLDYTNDIVGVSTLSAAITINLPSCTSARDGWVYEIQKVGTDTYGATLDPSGSETFVDGATTKVIYSAGNSATCTCRWNGSNGAWFFQN